MLKLPQEGTAVPLHPLLKEFPNMLKLPQEGTAVPLHPLLKEFPNMLKLPQEAQIIGREETYFTYRIF